jgi:hypothetical protein
VTATAQVEHVDGRQRLMARVEYRHDASTVNVFDGVATASRSTQDTITLALALGL